MSQRHATAICRGPFASSCHLALVDRTSENVLVTAILYLGAFLGGVVFFFCNLFTCALCSHEEAVAITRWRTPMVAHHATDRAHGQRHTLSAQ